jgi:quinol monooxygenase YgiN
MYGTVGRLQIKPGRLADLTDVIRELEANPGVHGMAIVAKDGSEIDYQWTIVWADKATHDANNERPEFPALYERLLAIVAIEPEWHSGKIVYQHQL